MEISKYDLFQSYVKYIKLHGDLSKVIFSIGNLFCDTINIDVCSSGNQNNIQFME